MNDVIAFDVFRLWRITLHVAPFNLRLTAFLPKTAAFCSSFFIASAIFMGLVPYWPSGRIKWAARCERAVSFECGRCEGLVTAFALLTSRKNVISSDLTYTVLASLTYIFTFIVFMSGGFFMGTSIAPLCVSLFCVSLFSVSLFKRTL